MLALSGASIVCEYCCATAVSLHLCATFPDLLGVTLLCGHAQVREAGHGRHVALQSPSKVWRISSHPVPCGAAARTAEQKSAAGKKAAETRKRKAEEAKGKGVKSREK